MIRIGFVHITNPPRWMHGHVIVFRCSANDAEPDFHFCGSNQEQPSCEVGIPATAILRPVEIWLDGDGDDIPVKLNDVNKVNCHWSTALPPCFMTCQAKSRFTS
jgi:hypothetical protein